jgi:dienelactone hydrolase
VDASYGGETLPIHLFLPRNAERPYQTIIFFPGIGATMHQRLSDHSQSFASEIAMGIAERGRAVVWPVYNGTYERNEEFDLHDVRWNHPQLYLEYVIQWSKDLSKSIDYLESRNEFAHEKLAYVGVSWGACLAPIMTTVDSRFVVGVLVAGGLRLA